MRRGDRPLLRGSPVRLAYHSTSAGQKKKTREIFWRAYCTVHADPSGLGLGRNHFLPLLYTPPPSLTRKSRRRTPFAQIFRPALITLRRTHWIRQTRPRHGHREGRGGGSSSADGIGSTSSFISGGAAKIPPGRYPRQWASEAMGGGRRGLREIGRRSSGGVLNSARFPASHVTAALNTNPRTRGFLWDHR